jgi:molybdopterin converting factor small subunit
MKIKLKSIGDLREYFGREPQEIDLATGATFADLLVEIDKRWGAALPSYMWNAEEKRFNGPVFFLIDKEVVLDMQTKLQDGLEVRIMRALAGG